MNSTPQTNNGTRVRLELRDDILNGRLLPGQKLNIRTLSSHMQVAPGAVREALSSLEGEGLVQLRAKKGFEVSAISESDFFELTQARLEIESVCLRLSIASGGDAWEGLQGAAVPGKPAVSLGLPGVGPPAPVQVPSCSL